MVGAGERQKGVPEIGPAVAKMMFAVPKSRQRLMEKRRLPAANWMVSKSRRLWKCNAKEGLEDRKWGCEATGGVKVERARNEQRNCTPANASVIDVIQMISEKPILDPPAVVLNL